MNYTILKIPSGEKGTDITVREMENFVEQGLRSPIVRSTALRILRSVPAKNQEAEVQAIFQWVKDNIRFVMDPYKKEMLHHPDRILELKAGDCDDIAILLSALLRSVGYPTRFKVISKKWTGEFHHVYTQAFVNSEWISLDATDQSYLMGYEPGNVTKSKIYQRSEAMRRFESMYPGRRFVEPLQALATKSLKYLPGTRQKDLLYRIFSKGEGVPLREQELVTRDRMLSEVKRLKRQITLADLQNAIRLVEASDLPVHIKRGAVKGIQTGSRLLSREGPISPGSSLLGDPLGGFNPFKAVSDAVGWIWDKAIKPLGPAITFRPDITQYPKEGVLPGGVPYEFRPKGFDLYQFLQSPLGIGALAVSFFLLLKALKKI